MSLDVENLLVQFSTYDKQCSIKKNESSKRNVRMKTHSKDFVNTGAFPLVCGWLQNLASDRLVWAIAFNLSVSFVQYRLGFFLHHLKLV